MKSSKVNELRIVYQLTTGTGAVVLVSAGLGAHPSVITRSRITGVIDPVTILPCPSSIAVTPKKKEILLFTSQSEVSGWSLSLETWYRIVKL